jgi:acyl-CoA thioester hydrolase
VTSLDDYPHHAAIPTRWADNDIYGHVNNVEYYAFFDTVINAWMIREGGLDIARGPVIGLCAESHCEFRAALTFPETVTAGLRVAHLGRSSVRYEIGLFGSDGSLAAAGLFGAVAGARANCGWVGRRERRPCAECRLIHRHGG